MQPMAAQIDLVDRDATGAQRSDHVREGGLQVVDMFQHGTREHHVHGGSQPRDAAGPDEVLDALWCEAGGRILGVRQAADQAVPFGTTASIDQIGQHSRVLGGQIDEREAVDAIDLARAAGDHQRGHAGQIPGAVFHQGLALQEGCNVCRRDLQALEVRIDAVAEVPRDVGGPFLRSRAPPGLARQAHVVGV